jgi:hypothetical protein
MSLATTANCRTLSISSSTNVNRSVTVDAGRFLVVTNGVTIIKSAGTSSVGLFMNDGHLTCTSMVVDGVTAGVPSALFRNRVPANNVQINGPLTIQTGGLIDLDPGASTGGTINITGNWTNNDNEFAFKEANSTVRFQGGVAQTISTAGSFQEKFDNLIMNKSANDLTLSAPISVRIALSWTSNGRIMGSSLNILSLAAGAIVSGEGNNRFVAGAVQKFGNTDFTFPIGAGTSYRPSLVSGLVDPISAFTAMYVASSPQLAFGTARDPSLHHVSDCEYWVIARSGGTDDAFLWLSWDTPTSCGVTQVNDMRVAYFSGSQWLDRGAGSVTGNTTAGTVRTEDRQSIFGRFTLASSSSENPLPIQLLDFSAVAEGDEVQCAWTTATERDNNLFTVERGSDAVHFAGIGTVPGAGNSQAILNYGFTDPSPLAGLSYYRLRQTDYDGTTTVSDAVPVFFGPHVRDLVVTSEGLVRHDLPLGSTYQLLDTDGRVVARGSADVQVFQLPVGGLARGVYIVRLTDGTQLRTARFVP